MKQNYSMLGRQVGEFLGRKSDVLIVLRSDIVEVVSNTYLKSDTVCSTTKCLNPLEHATPIVNGYKKIIQKAKQHKSSLVVINEMHVDNVSGSFSFDLYK